MASGDLCSVEEVKEAASIEATTWDALIERYIATASGVLRTEARREFAATQANPQTRTFDVGPWYRGRELPVGDLAGTPTAVTVIDSEGVLVHTVNVATEVVLLPLVRAEDEPIRDLRFRSSVPLAPGYQVTVAGDWGFPAVPPGIREACVETVREWLASTQAVTPMGAELEGVEPTSRALPLRARVLLRHYRTIGVA